jgi:hypothetical protein
MELFSSEKWKEAIYDPSHLTSIDPNVLGIKNLKRALQKTLYKRVKENFPLLKAKMRGLKGENEKHLQRLGDPRDDARDQRNYLSNIQTFYEREVDRSLNGDYRYLKDYDHVSHLRYHIKKFNHEFEKEMEDKGYTYAWRSLEENDAEIQGQLEGPRPGIFAWIYQTWDCLIGSEVKGDVPQNLKKKLFNEQTDSWESIAKSYLEKVKRTIRDCNDDLFNEVCKDNLLRGKIRDLLEPFEIKAFAAAEAELENILGDLDYIDSWHPLLTIDISEYQRLRATRQAERDNLPSQPGGSVGPTNQVERLASSLSSYALNNKRIYEIHDWLHAFWGVAFARFVDNIIIQVVERHLLGQNGPLRLFNRTWIDYLGREDLERLAGEDEATINEREVIKKRLEGLKEALAKADLAMH